ncbi:MAG: isopentenyl-adenosine tRNA methylthiolase, partial [Pseudomonadota bacterium]
KTFGCQMNEYDSSRMADMLHAAEGLETTEVVEDADVILLNNVIQAFHKSTSLFLKLKSLITYHRHA